MKSKDGKIWMDYWIVGFSLWISARRLPKFPKLRESNQRVRRSEICGIEGWEDPDGLLDGLPNKVRLLNLKGWLAKRSSPFEPQRMARQTKFAF